MSIYFCHIDVTLRYTPRLADAFVNYGKLHRLSQRLSLLAACPKIAFYGPTLTNQVSEAHEVLCKLTSALRETNHSLETFNALQPTPRIADAFLEQARALELSTDALCVQLKHICDLVNSSSLPILLEGLYSCLS